MDICQLWGGKVVGADSGGLPPPHSVSGSHWLDPFPWFGLGFPVLEVGHEFLGARRCSDPKGLETHFLWKEACGSENETLINSWGLLWIR